MKRKERSRVQTVEGFTKIPNAIFDIKMKHKIYAIGVFALLIRRRNSFTAACFPSHKNISESIGISVSQVKRAVAVLESIGLIQYRKRAGRSNYYFLKDDPKQWDSELFITEKYIESVMTIHSL